MVWDARAPSPGRLLAMVVVVVVVVPVVVVVMAVVVVVMVMVVDLRSLLPGRLRLLLALRQCPSDDTARPAAARLSVFSEL